MESFIEKQTKLLKMQPTETPEKDPKQIPKEYVDHCLSDTAVLDQDLDSSDPGKWQALCSHWKGNQGEVH